MVKKKRVIFIKLLICFITLSLYLCSCKKNMVASDFDTSYTKCICNGDGTYSFFVYAAPIQYEEDGKFYMVDTGLVKTSLNHYAYENKSGRIKTYFPKDICGRFLIVGGEEKIEFQFNDIMEDFTQATVVEYKNFYNDNITAVLYSCEKKGIDLYMYPTISGIHIECNFKNSFFNPKITVFSQADSLNNKNGYYELCNQEIQKVIIYKPIALCEKKLDLNNQMVGKYLENAWEFSMENNYENMDGKAIKMDFSIEKYVNKMPDSSVYSKMRNNCYLMNYAIIGENEIYGEGWDYIRFRINFFIKTDESNILNAEYCVKKLYSENENNEIIMYENQDDWSSTQMTWDDRVFTEYDEVCSVGRLSENQWLQFDVTDYVKKCVEDIIWKTESLGVRIMEKEKYSLIATSDNSTYVPYLRIDLKELPENFNANNNTINP